MDKAICKRLREVEQWQRWKTELKDVDNGTVARGYHIRYYAVCVIYSGIRQTMYDFKFDSITDQMIDNLLSSLKIDPKEWQI